MKTIPKNIKDLAIWVELGTEAITLQTFTKAGRGDSRHVAPEAATTLAKAVYREVRGEPGLSEVRPFLSEGCVGWVWRRK